MKIIKSKKLFLLGMTVAFLCIITSLSSAMAYPMFYAKTPYTYYTSDGTYQDGDLDSFKWKDGDVIHWTWGFKLNVYTWFETGPSFPTVRLTITYKYHRYSSLNSLQLWVYYSGGGSDAINFLAPTGDSYLTRSFYLPDYKLVYKILICVGGPSSGHVWIDQLMVGYENFPF